LYLDHAARPGLESAQMAASRSKTFRKMAADAMRAGRKASPGNDRDAHFDVAASYKSLANDDEWMSGERRRSHELRRWAKKPKGPDARSIT
jgi:hypothetical protein